MPEKPLTIATYLAGAGLTAITLVYVFGPTFFIDGDSSSASSRKKGVVGLSNPANDCFINSVLQALAGLGDLRNYLTRETHRRNLDGPAVYSHPIPDPTRPDWEPWKLQMLQEGFVTQGLKEIIDALNERPIYKKTISAAGFVGVLEQAFKQRISRQQQDAQEFLQVVAERLDAEYHAGHRARKRARKLENIKIEDHPLDEESVDQKLNQLSVEDGDQSQLAPTISEPEPEPESTSSPENIDNEATATSEGEKRQSESAESYEDEEGFPLEGGSQSQIECLTCGFKPKATKSTFCSLTLSVPQVSSTSLSSCFDQMFKTEYIEDFKCEKCRLVHTLNTFKQEMARSNSEKFKAKTQIAIDRLDVAIKTNPEEELKDVELPDRKFAPKRKIAKHVEITKFPKVLAIHLSRSIFDAERSTMKNSAKVSFPERLPLGPLLKQRVYRLVSVVCHKGSHHSGHYESFRRQNVYYPPYATTNTFQVAGVYSKPSTPLPSQISTPQIGAVKRPDEPSLDTSTLSSTPELLSPTSAVSSPSSSSLPYTNGRHSTDSSRNDNGRPHSLSTSTSGSKSSEATTKHPGPTSAPRDPETGSIRSIARSARSTLSKSVKKSPSDNATKSTTQTLAKRKKSQSNRWWRISDEKIKESKTSDVLGMQREVYMLFYELEAGDENS